MKQKAGPEADKKTGRSETGPSRSSSSRTIRSVRTAVQGIGSEALGLLIVMQNWAHCLPLVPSVLQQLTH